MADDSDHEEGEENQTVIKLAHSRRNIEKKRLIVVLENASLEIVKVLYYYNPISSPNSIQYKHVVFFN